MMSAAAAVLLAAAVIPLAAPGPHAFKAPLCQTLGDRTSPQAWFDVHSGASSSLVTRIDELICSAAPDSTIDIKSWFFAPGDAITRRMLTELDDAHVVRGVTVNVMLGGNAYSTHRGLSWRRTVAALHPFATIYACSGGCRAGRVKGHPQAGRSHAKWITVSRTVMGTPAVVSMSANPSPGAWTGEDNSAIYVNSRRIYHAFRGRWDSLVDCTVRSCRNDRNSPVVYKHGVYYNGRHNLVSTRSGGTAVWFDPQPVDPEARILRALRCDNQPVDVVNAFAKDTGVNTQLQRLRRDGCPVHLILTWWPASKHGQRQLAGFDVHCVAGVVQHDKFILVDGEVIAGSQDFAGSDAWSSSDQQGIATHSPTVYRGYTGYYAALRRSAHTCTVHNVRPAGRPSVQFVPPPIIPVA